MAGSPVDEVFQGTTRIRSVSVVNETDGSAVPLASASPVSVDYKMWKADIQEPSGSNLTISAIREWTAPTPTVNIAVSDEDASAGTFTITETNILGSETITANANTDVPTIEVFLTLTFDNGEIDKTRYLIIVRRAL